MLALSSLGSLGHVWLSNVVNGLLSHDALKNVNQGWNMHHLLRVLSVGVEQFRFDFSQSLLVNLVFWVTFFVTVRNFDHLVRFAFELVVPCLGLKIFC